MQFGRPTCSSRGIRQLKVKGIESKQSGVPSDKKYWHCKTCGFICDDERDSACPVCGTEDFNKPARRT